MSNKYDVIIIGSGIGGLICGTKLAKNGLRVLIVEKHNKPGGCVTSCRKHGFNFDYGAHIIGSCNKNGILYYYLNKLGIKADFIRLNPTERFVFPDQTIEVPQDIDQYSELLKNRFPCEMKGIDSFFNEVEKIARSFSSTNLLSRYEGLTFEKLLRTYFKDEKLMSILAAEFRYLGSTTRDLAATSMCLMMISYLRDGTYFPRGGSQQFSDSISRKFKEYGGVILLKTEAVRIMTQDNKVTGIITHHGEVFESGVVVSNGDAIRTFSNLLGEDVMGKEYMGAVSSLKIGSSSFMAYLGVNSTVRLENKGGWYHSSYGLDLDSTQSLYVFVPSLVDPSLAPPCKNVVILAIPFPYEFSKVNDWGACAQELRSSILDLAGNIIPGLKNGIEYEEYATPKTIENYTYNSQGSMYGWQMTVDQSHERRLSYDTPIEGLYMVGQWTNPGCGVVSVATSGWIVADKVSERIEERSGLVCAR